MAWLRSLAIGVITANTACGTAQAPTSFLGPAPAHASDRRMARLAERILDQLWAAHPIEASAHGYPKYSDRLPDWSSDAVQADVGRLERLRRALREFEPARLSVSWAIDRELLLRRLAKDEFFYIHYAPFDWNAISYTEALREALYHLTRAPENPRDWRVQLESLIARIEQIPAFLDHAEARLLNAPLVLVPFLAVDGPGPIDTLETVVPTLLEPFPQLQERFRIAQPAAVQALIDFGAFTNEQLSARPQRDWRLGSDLYARLLLHAVGLRGLSSTDLQTQAETELQRLRLEMYQRALPLFESDGRNDGINRAQLQKLPAETRLRHVVNTMLRRLAADTPSPQTDPSLLSEMEKTVAHLRRFIEQSHVLTLPPSDGTLAVEPAPPAIDGLAVVFLNAPSAFSSRMDHQLFVSAIPVGGRPHYLRRYNPHVLRALAIHEALPGHYVQRFWSRQSPMDSHTKRALESVAMTEGWAVLADQLMREAGAFRDDPAADLFSLKLRLRVCINALVDIRFHTDVTTTEPDLDRWAIKLMTEEGFYEPAEAGRILRRAKLYPGELVTPFVGAVEMIGLYRDMQLNAGENFNSKAALDRILSYGAIPPDMIRAQLTAEGLL